jgi:hypothetical protein
MCVYLQASPTALPWLQKAGIVGSVIDIERVRDGLAAVAPIAASVGFFRTADCASKNEVLQDQKESLLRQTRDSFAQAFASKLGVQVGNGQTPQLSVRMFLPERACFLDPRVPLARLLHRKDWSPSARFRIRNVEGLSDTHYANGLSFVVSPSKDAQGLVGSCYTHKEIVLDDDLQNPAKRYNLTVQQSGATCDLVFSLCVPLFRMDDTSDRVVAIVAFDSSNVLFKNVIRGAPAEAIDEAMMYARQYSNFLHDDVPELFG